MQSVTAFVFGFYTYKRLVHIFTTVSATSLWWEWMEMAALGLDIALMIFLLAPAALATAAAVSQDIPDPCLTPSHAAGRVSRRSHFLKLLRTP